MAAPPGSGPRHLPESHRSTPLAPSQEIAYRQKCIYLKRRLQEIETNNDNVRQRLTRERHFQDKMRLNRAILLNHMKDLVENPSQKYNEDDMAGIRRSSHFNSHASGLQDARGNGYSDTTDASSNDDIAEPEERPVRIKRARDGTPRKSSGGKNKTAAATEQATSAYNNVGLPHIALESADSNAPSALQTIESQASARISSSSSNPAQPQTNSHSDNQQNRDPSRTAADIPEPERPLDPFDQFSEHLQPQLEADHIPPQLISTKIAETWYEIGQVGQQPWQEKFDNEMLVYREQMDQFLDRAEIANNLVNGSGGSGAGFSAVNN